VRQLALAGRQWLGVRLGIAGSHGEADPMHFRRQRAALLTLQERTTRITLGGRLASKRAEPTMDQIVAKLAVLPKRARRAATFDDGGEWARHERLRAELAMRT
jgi:transposase, IS30 family